MSGPMTSILDGVSRHLASLPGPAGVVGRQVCADLAAPVRVAVVGRVSSGKSTLVNALLGARIAPTGAGETTLLPCWFEHGRFTTATAVAGERRIAVGLDGDHLPDRLPAEVNIWQQASGAWLEVTLAAPLLTEFELVDTPGVASVSQEVSARTAALLGESTGACAKRVDALLLVLTGSLQAEDAEAARMLIGSVPAVAGVPVVAALTRSDTLAPDLTEALARAGDLAAAIHSEHADTLAAVVPVVGLLASTGVTGALSERNVRDLRTLAGELLDDQHLILSDARLFADVESAVDPTNRRELVNQLGLSGLSWAIDLVRAHPDVNAQRLSDALEQVSGVARLVQTLRDTMVSRAELIKASAALARLETIAHDTSLPPGLSQQILGLAGAPQLLNLQLRRGVHLLAATRVPLPPDLAEEVAAARARGVEGLADRVPAKSASRWRGWQMLSDGPGKAGAAIMIRAHQVRAGGGVP